MIRRAVCVLIEDDGKFLSVSRRNDNTQWGFPGGKVDSFDRNEFEAICRETEEEISLRISECDLIPIFVDVCYGKDGNHFLTTTFLYIHSSEPVMSIFRNHAIPEDSMELNWLTKEQLSDPKISPFWEYNQKVFINYDELKRN